MGWREILRSNRRASECRASSIILAVGFGLEKRATTPYWRNETLGQPELGLGRRIYLVCGHGDGALVDLFRIRISGFRQDRILVELFSDSQKLRHRLQDLKHELDEGSISAADIYERFDKVTAALADDFTKVTDKLRKRLRTDTAAVVKLSPSIDSFREVFNTRASFQNRFLFFALYKVGGVIPYSTKVHENTTVEELIRHEYGIKRTNVVRRYGIEPGKVIVLRSKRFPSGSSVPAQTLQGHFMRHKGRDEPLYGKLS